MLAIMSLTAHQSQRIDDALIQAARLGFDLDVASLAALAGYSSGHFSRLFKQRFGLSPGLFLRHRRIDRFAALLRQGKPVTEAALEAGFGSSSRSHQAARDAFGMTPSSLARGGRNETIAWGIADCLLGRVLVASTAQGLCSVQLGDDDAFLVEELSRRFPKARLVQGGQDFRTTIEQVVALIDDGRPLDSSLPLDLRGTVFQQRVWSALRQIPVGQTITYSELAQRIGRPKAIRAAASACGANRLAVVIPCHRVVARDGGLGGYRWGLERKRKLLESERGASRSKTG